MHYTYQESSKKQNNKSQRHHKQKQYNIFIKIKNAKIDKKKKKHNRRPANLKSRRRKKHVQGQNKNKFSWKIRRESFHKIMKTCAPHKKSQFDVRATNIEISRQNQYSYNISFSVNVLLFV